MYVTGKGKGFTLIEVSIVLVIIGLVIGSVVAGKHLVRQSELQSIATDVNKFKTAINTFYDKYGGYPGDIPDATNYWGAENADHATCIALTSVSTGVATCNGNGNGLVGDSAAQWYEVFRMWQHLTNAKMLDGKYSGVMGTPGIPLQSLVGVNVPQSKIANAGYTFGFMVDMVGNGSNFDGSYGHTIWYGSNTASNRGTYAPAITTAEALSLDSKIDEGKPAYGNVRGLKNGQVDAPSCTTTTVSSTAAYALATSGIKCSLLFITGQ